MGHSVTCNFQVNVNLSDGTKLLGIQTCYGAMTFKEVRGIMLAEQKYQVEKSLRIGNPDGGPLMVDSAEIWPQTARGRKQIKLDYAIMNRKGEIEHKAIS